MLIHEHNKKKKKKKLSTLSMPFGIGMFVHPPKKVKRMTEIMLSLKKDLRKITPSVVGKVTMDKSLQIATILGKRKENYHQNHQMDSGILKWDHNDSPPPFHIGQLCTLLLKCIQLICANANT